MLLANNRRVEYCYMLESEGYHLIYDKWNCTLQVESNIDGIKRETEELESLINDSNIVGHCIRVPPTNMPLFLGLIREIKYKECLPKRFPKQKRDAQ